MAAEFSSVTRCFFTRIPKHFLKFPFSGATPRWVASSRRDIGRSDNAERIFFWIIVFPGVVTDAFSDAEISKMLFLSMNFDGMKMVLAGSFRCIIS